MDRLAKLPVFLDLEGKRALVAGAGAGALWKIELLAAAGARVAVFTARSTRELGALATRLGEQAVIHERGWVDADFTGVAVALLQPDDDPETIARFRRHATAAGALVNVIDTPAACDFQFGTIVNRYPAVIGISTDGAAPVLAQALRRRIEAILPAELGEWTAAAKRFRHRVAERLPVWGDRRRFWEKLVDSIFAPGAPADKTAALDAIVAEVARADTTGPTSVVVEHLTVHPADAEQLTIAAVRLLQAADIIVHHPSIAPAILELGRREALRVTGEGDGALAGMNVWPGARIVHIKAATVA